MAGLKPRFQTPQDSNDTLNTQFSATTASMTKNAQVPNWFTIKASCQSNIPVQRKETLNPSQDKAYAHWELKVPAQADSAFFTLDFTMRNGLQAPQAIDTTPIYVSTRMALPSVKVDISSDESGQAIKHLEQ